MKKKILHALIVCLIFAAMFTLVRGYWAQNCIFVTRRVHQTLRERSPKHLEERLDDFEEEMNSTNWLVSSCPVLLECSYNQALNGKLLIALEFSRVDYTRKLLMINSEITGTDSTDTEKISALQKQYSFYSYQIQQATDAIGKQVEDSKLPDPLSEIFVQTL